MMDTRLIPIAEQLPPYYQEVLLYFSDGPAIGYRGKLVDREGRLTYKDYWAPPERYSFCSYSEEPTHWMGLPSVSDDKGESSMGYAKYKWTTEEVEHTELSKFLNEAEEGGGEVFSIISQNTHSVLVILRRSNKAPLSR